MMPEEKISKLLRLKRYEQPPPRYFDDFLREFHARQRAELIQRPIWEVIWDRLSLVAPTFQVPQLAYAAVVVLALAASAIIVARPSAKPADSRLTLSLTSPRPVTIGENLPVIATSASSQSVHYVLPTRPVSHASSRRF